MNCKVCHNLSGKNPALSFFRFPSDYNRCREWAERCNITQLFDRFGAVKFYKSFRICSEHFDPKFIVFDGRKKKLLNCAVPMVVKPKKKFKLIRTVTEPRHEDTDLRVSQKLLENLCRFCAEETTELTDIYSWRGKTLELEEKIKVFPIRVSKLDKLPLKVCNACIVKISKFHEFVRNCVKADIRLKTILGTTDVSPSTNGEIRLETQCNDILKDLKTSRSPINTKQLQISNVVKKRVFVFLHSDEIPTKEAYERNDTQSNNPPYIADADFSYVSSEKDVLLSKSNDKFGNKFVNISSEGNPTLGKNMCNICSKTFSALEILESHRKAHSLQPDELGRFMCQICDKLFPNQYRLNEHNRIHTGEYPFKCSLCDKKFHKMALLKQHSIVHESNKRFICSICNLRSSRKGNLIQHLRTHSQKILKKENKKLFPQPDTDRIKSKSFEIGKSSPLQPERDATNNTLILSCATCQAQFLNFETLERHFKSHTIPIEQNLSQSLSVEGYLKTKPTSRKVKRCHPRVYQCEECGVRFKRKDTLINHVRIHTGERPFVCGSCGFAFKQKGDCLKHERNHQKTTEENAENRF